MIKIDSTIDNLDANRRNITVMVSSSVYGFEDQIDEICAYLNHLGYDVISSKQGTLKADPRLGNFENCLKAVEHCDLFLGIIRPYVGSGKMGDKSITFREFETARLHHKPSWYIIDTRVKWTSDFVYQLDLRDTPDKLPWFIRKIWKCNYHIAQYKHMQLPRLFDLFRPKPRQFSEECFEMEQFVNQRGKYSSKDGNFVNNWMQYCSSLTEMKIWIQTNFGDENMIQSIIK